MPASLENNPRCTPVRMASMSVEPMKPPVAACALNALSKINCIAGRMKSACAASTNTQPTVYTTAMVGTQALQVCAIPFSPHSSTAATRMHSTVAVAQVGMFSALSCSTADTALACVRLPMPKAAIAVSTANTTASHLQCSPCSSTYIGPPTRCPSASTRR